jgi:hypothetical protein
MKRTKKVIRKIKKNKGSEFGKLNMNDFWKGISTGALTGVIGALMEVGVAGLTFSKTTLLVLVGGALSGMLAYLTRKGTTNSEGKQFTTEGGKNIISDVLVEQVSKLFKLKK